MLNRVEMNVIDVPAQIPLVADEVLPIPALQNAALAFPAAAVADALGAGNSPE
jgi:hypothetical protein